MQEASGPPSEIIENLSKELSEERNSNNNCSTGSKKFTPVSLLAKQSSEAIMRVDSSSSLVSQDINRDKCPSMDNIMTIDSDSSVDRAESIRKSCDEIMTITDSSDRGEIISQFGFLVQCFLL